MRTWLLLFQPHNLQPPDGVTKTASVVLAKPLQPTLWEQDGYSYWAVVTNLPWRGKKVLEWHREKAGTIEHFHHVAKNELGLGILPCGRFGADAAWARLNVLAFNLLSFLKRTALPPSLKRARPKAFSRSASSTPIGSDAFGAKTFSTE